MEWPVGDLVVACSLARKSILNTVTRSRPVWTFDVSP